MLKKKLAVAILGALMFNPVILPPNNFLPAPIVCAEVKTIEADGYYIMGDGTEENQAVAKERARADAKRAASEQACTFVESISEIKNNNLTRDEIYTISAAILKVISDPVNPEISGGSVMFHCHITVTVNTSNVDKFLGDRQKLNEATRQNNELRAENERLQAEINALNKKFVAASAEEKKDINAEIKRNEEQFTAVQWTEKASNCIEYGDYDKAIDYLYQALELNPKYDAAWINLGFAHLGLGDLNQSIRYINKAVELNPEKTANWIFLATVYLASNDNHKVFECLEKAKELNSDYAQDWIIIASLYSSLKHYGKTIECLTKVTELAPQNPIGWLMLSVAYEHFFNYSKANECYTKFIELTPKDTDHKKWREKARETLFNN